MQLTNISYLDTCAAISLRDASQRDGSTGGIVHDVCALQRKPASGAKVVPARTAWDEAADRHIRRDGPGQVRNGQIVVGARADGAQVEEPLLRASHWETRGEQRRKKGWKKEERGWNEGWTPRMLQNRVDTPHKAIW